jgi:hypothetical protein
MDLKKYFENESILDKFYDVSKKKSKLNLKLYNYYLKKYH